MLDLDPESNPDLKLCLEVGRLDVKLRVLFLVLANKLGVLTINSQPHANCVPRNVPQYSYCKKRKLTTKKTNLFFCKFVTF